MTVAAVLAQATATLANADSAEARLDAELIVAHVLDRRRLELTLRADEPIGADQCAAITTLIAERATGRPLAYVLGTREFYGLTLHVDERALIPRAETELLVEQTLLRLRDTRAPRIADLGTGCGAIALALAHERRDAFIVAVDLSEPALALARKNAATLGLTDVEFRHGDLCGPLIGERFEALCCNLPYVPSAVIDTLAIEVRSHEPRLALDGGADGLDLYRRLARAAPAVLNRSGFIASEFGIGQTETMRSLFSDWQAVEILRDYGGHERVLIAQRPITD